MALPRPQARVRSSERVLAAVSRLIDRRRGWFQALADVGAWTIGLLIALWGAHGDVPARSAVLLGAVAAVLLVGTAFSSGLYRSRWQYGSLEEIAVVLGPILAATVGIALVDALLLEPSVPLANLCSAVAFATVLMGGLRYTWRLLIDHGHRPSPADRQRLIVFGAGRAGQKIITWLLSDPESAYVPVALLDDDPSRRHKRIKGLEVTGGRSEIARVARETGAHALVVAIPSADAAVVRDVLRAGEEAGLAVRVLPPSASSSTARPASPTSATSPTSDLLGRHRDRHRHRPDRRLPHAAGGCWSPAPAARSARSCAARSPGYAPAELIMLDRDESALHARPAVDRGPGPARLREPRRRRHPRPRRLARAVRRAPARGRLPRRRAQAPAAARDAPGRGGARPTSWGTWNVCWPRRAAGVERVRQHLDRQGGRPDQRARLHQADRRAADRRVVGRGTAAARYLSVRFGNVLGSRGSVLTAFRAQIAARRPGHGHPPRRDPLLHDDRGGRRSSSSRPARSAGAGEALVLDMGEPVRIDDVARRLIDQRPSADRHRLHRPARRARSSTRSSSATARPTSGRSTR